jgi:hypothetical protein
MIESVSWEFPRYSERTRESGRMANRRRLAESGVIRPEGIRRHDFFKESSMIAEGRRWFAMPQIRRLVLIQRRRVGR